MKNQLTEEKKQLLRYYYEEKHYGQDKCAKLLGPGVGRKSIKEALVEMNLPIRSFEEAKKYAISHKKDKDENYFSKESHNMGWVLGFLASDGTIGSKDNHIKIGLSVKDVEILEKIKKEIKIENKITYYTTNKGYDVAELTWVCAQHKKDLAKYGIVPKKTFILEPPLALSREYWIDYIRGYFDGDGSILIKQNILMFQIGSARKEILEWIINYFYDEYNIKKVNILTDNRRLHPYYYFTYASKSSKKIYEVLYNESPMFLSRKREKLEQYLSKQVI